MTIEGPSESFSYSSRIYILIDKELSLCGRGQGLRELRTAEPIPLSARNNRIPERKSTNHGRPFIMRCGTHSSGFLQSHRRDRRTRQALEGPSGGSVDSFARPSGSVETREAHRNGTRGVARCRARRPNESAETWQFEASRLTRFSD